jgi:hypothetical protein
MSALDVHIIGTNLPGARFGDTEPVHVALERGKDYENAQRADLPEVRFDFTVSFVDQDFKGPYVTGKRGDRFIRLRWGVPGDHGGWNGFGRTKVHLSGHEELAAQAVESGRRIEVTVDLTGHKGGPRLATVKDDALEWRLGPPRS